MKKIRDCKEASDVDDVGEIMGQVENCERLTCNEIVALVKEINDEI